MSISFNSNPSPFFGGNQGISINLPGLSVNAGPAYNGDVMSMLNPRTASAAAVSAVATSSSSAGSWGSRARVGYAGAGMTSLGGVVKSSLFIGAAMSVFANLVWLCQGRENFAMAGTNVAGDVVASGVCGLAGGAASMAGAAMLGGMLGSGIFLTLGVLACGLAGIMAGDYLLRQSQAFQNFQASVYQTLS